MNSKSLTKTTHKKPYATISPLRPEVSQKGRTVLVTGGNQGIGYAIALAFGQAGASCVIIAGRRPEATAAAAATLQSQIDGQADDSNGKKTQYVDVTCDVSRAEDVEHFWDKMRTDGVHIDVLVLNVARISAKQGILERGTEKIWGDYDVNVRAQLHMTERFYKQQDFAPSVRRAPKFLVMVSTMAIHNWEINSLYPSYGLSKNAGTLVMQMISRETSPQEMQVVSFHPGAVYTQSAKTAGWKEDDFDWHDSNLAGQFAVWAASTEASFLHGRFVWCEWDVDELSNGDLRKRIDQDETFLTIGVHGL